MRSIGDRIKNSPQVVFLEGKNVSGSLMPKLKAEVREIIDRAAEAWCHEYMEMPTPDADGYYTLDAYSSTYEVVKNAGRWKSTTPMTGRQSCGFDFILVDRRHVILNVGVDLDLQHGDFHGDTDKYQRWDLSNHRMVQIGTVSEKITSIPWNQYTATGVDHYGLHSEVKEVILSMLQDLERDE